jgi:hypothetical protein
MFVGKARSLPKNGAPERSFTQVGPDLARKLKTWLERPAKIKHSSLLPKLIINEEKNVL